MATINLPGVPLDYRTFALKRAAEMGVFQNQNAPAVFEDNFQNIPADAGSQWQVLTQTGAAGTATGPAGKAGGIVRLDTTAAAGKGVTVTVGKVTGAKPAVIADPVASGSRWYLFWVFSIASTFDSQTVALLNLFPQSGATDGIFFGFDGQFSGSTTNFMAEDNVVAAVSTITPGAAGTWHYLEAWQLGVANQVLFRYDNEPTKTLTLGAAGGVPLSLQMEVLNGTTAASRQLDVDHVVVLMPGMVLLPG